MTEWWAFKPVTSAFEKARKLLLEPFNAWTWLKLVVIAFFVGTGASRLSSSLSSAFNYQTESPDVQAIGQAVKALTSNPEAVYIIIGIFVILIALALIFAYLRNAFSFVMIRALASGDVHVIKPFMDNLGRGFRLFVFTLAARLLTLAVAIVGTLALALCAYLAIKVGVTGIAGIVTLALAVIAGLCILLLVLAFVVAMSIFVGFTYDFVAPMVYFKNVGIVEAWQWLWGSIKKDWQQYSVYIISRWALELAVGIALSVIVILLAVVAALVVVPGALLATATAKTSIILAAAIGVLLLFVIALFVVAVMVVSMPVAVYFRYYSLDVLKQIDPSSVQYSGRFSPAALPA